MRHLKKIATLLLCVLTMCTLLLVANAETYTATTTEEMITALEGAQSGDTVALEKDATFSITATLSIPAGVTLEGNGATINVEDGTYSSFRADGADWCKTAIRTLPGALLKDVVVNGMYKVPYGITTEVDASIDHCEIMQFNGGAIYLENGVSLTNCHLHNNARNISGWGGTTATERPTVIRDNTIESATYGLHFDQAYANTYIENNTINGCWNSGNYSGVVSFAGNTFHAKAGDYNLLKLNSISEDGIALPNIYDCPADLAGAYNAGAIYLDLSALTLSETRKVDLSGVDFAISSLDIETAESNLPYILLPDHCELVKGTNGLYRVTVIAEKEVAVVVPNVEDVTVEGAEDATAEITAIVENEAVANFGETNIAEAIPTEEGAKIQIELRAIDMNNAEGKKVTFEVHPITASGVKIENSAIQAEITFRLPVASTTLTGAVVYHGEEMIGYKPVEKDGDDQFITVTASTFSEYSYVLTNDDPTEWTEYVTVSGIAGFAGTKFPTMNDAYDAISAVLAEAVGLGQEPLYTKEAFDAIFTENGAITWTIVGEQRLDETGRPYFLSFGRKAAHFNEETADCSFHITSITLVGGSGDKSDSLAFATGATVPYEWWSDKCPQTSVKVEDLTLSTASGNSYIGIGQAYNRGLDLTINHCNVNGMIYYYNNAAGSITMTNNVFTGTTDISYAAFIQGSATEPLNIVFNGNTVSGYGRSINIDQINCTVEIKNNTFTPGVGYSAVQISGCKTAVIEGNTVYDQGNVLTLHEKLAKDSVENRTITVKNNTIRAVDGVTGYLIYDDMKAEGYDGTYFTLVWENNHVDDGIVTTEGVKGSKVVVLGTYVDAVVNPTEAPSTGFSGNMLIIPLGEVAGQRQIALLAGIDSLNYQEVGFEVTFGGKSLGSFKSTVVYRQVTDGASNTWTSASLGGATGGYLFVQTMGISTEDTLDDFGGDTAVVTVTPYALTMEGETVTVHSYDIPITYFFN